MDAANLSTRLMYEEALARYWVGELEETDEQFWNKRFQLAGRARAIEALGMIQNRSEELAEADGVTNPVVNMVGLLELATKVFNENTEAFLQEDMQRLFEGQSAEIDPEHMELIRKEYARGYSLGLQAATEPPNLVRVSLFTEFDVIYRALNERFWEALTFLRQKSEQGHVDADELKTISYTYGIVYLLEVARGYISAHMGQTVTADLPVTSSREDLARETEQRFDSVRNGYITQLEDNFPRYESDFKKARFAPHIEELEKFCEGYTGVKFKHLPFDDCTTGFIDAREWILEAFEQFGEMSEEEWEQRAAQKFPAKFPQAFENKQEFSIN